MSVRRFRAADRVAAPWKNGGGITREVAAWPPGAGLDDFDWRVSIAEVSRGGPFSTFPGVDRVLTVIDGAGLALAVAAMAPVRLDTDSAPYAFPGDVSCDAELTGGPIRDLNVMVRRSARYASVRRLLVVGETPIAAVAEQTLVVALDPLAVVGAEPLLAEDAVLLPRGAVVTLSGSGARAVLVELDPVAGS